ncbi:uncharacterized protein LOC119052119 isoform X2 [Artibeus jamaicensis]|uniref:uncharacterized protein LOC119052119 isoform X2 n=1 Tax=Artibeus jamaicensis TaxID=9417 RepID=UPI00235A6CFD|nr:uncharacterized protein LOC119052119 isoform X2 [Artibeus jamaicensis]
MTCGQQVAPCPAVTGYELLLLEHSPHFWKGSHDFGECRGSQAYWGLSETKTPGQRGAVPTRLSFHERRAYSKVRRGLNTVTREIVSWNSEQTCPSTGRADGLLHRAAVDAKNQPWTRRACGVHGVAPAEIAQAAAEWPTGLLGAFNTSK